MATILIGFTILSIIICAIGFVLTLLGIRFLYKGRLISLEDYLYLIKIKAFSWLGAFVVIWLIGSIVILIIM